MERSNVTVRFVIMLVTKWSFGKMVGCLVWKGSRPPTRSSQADLNTPKPLILLLVSCSLVNKFSTSRLLNFSSKRSFWTKLSTLISAVYNSSGP